MRALRLISSNFPELCIIHRLNSTSANLTDSYGRFHNYLRISLTEKCNLRCTYCMPLEGVTLTARDDLLTVVEFKRIIKIFTTCGVSKIRFTGGEPTSSKYLKELISYAKNIPTIKSIGITTNGVLLGNQLGDLLQVGLTHVNISLDTLDPKRFESITRREGKNIYKVLSSVYNAINKGLKVKLNCVVIRGVNDDEISHFIKLTKDTPLDLRFIELMPFDDNKWNRTSLVSYFEMIDILHSEGHVLTKQSKELLDPHDTTKWYNLQGHLGRVGFISSMSSHFCGGCNRLRITADGKLKTCLFGSDEASLRDLLRKGDEVSDEDIRDFIQTALGRKHWSLGGHATPEDLSLSKNRPMILIGG